MKKLLRKISMVACSLVLSITMVAATSSSSLALNSAGWSPWIVKSNLQLESIMGIGKQV